MRPSRRLFRISSAALILTSLAACDKRQPESTPEVEQASPAKAASAEPTSFEAVARYLDSGGGLYAYLSTEGFVKTASEVIQQGIQAFETQGSLQPEQKKQMEAAWNSLKPFLRNSGIKEISGIGISSLAIRPGYYRTKSILHHYKDQANGFIWKLNGGQARALEIIPFLPETTAAAGSLDFTMAPIWAELTAQAATNNALRTALERCEAQIKAGTGLDFATLLNGLGPNHSYVITLDEKNPFTIPHDGQGEPVTIPEPRIALLIQIRDEAILKQLDERLSALPMISAADHGDLKLRKVNLPLPFPFLSPTIAWKNDLLILSSNEALITELLEVKAGKKPGLNATERFKEAMADLPSPASTFGYVDPLFSKTVMALQMQSLKQEPGADAGAQQFLQSIWNMQTTHVQAGVGQNTPEGWFSVNNGGPGPSQIATVAAVVPAAIISAVAAPNYLRAKERAEAAQSEEGRDEKAVAALHELRLLDAAIDQWALDKNKRPGDQPTTDDLKPYVKPGTPLHVQMEASPGATTVIVFLDCPAVTIPKVDDHLTISKEFAEKFSVPSAFWGPYYHP